MTVVGKLVSSPDRRDQISNQELAKKIESAKDKNSIEELAENLYNKRKNIQSGCIEVFDEITAIQPALVSGYAKALVALFDHKNNRLQ